MTNPFTDWKLGGSVMCPAKKQAAWLEGQQVKPARKPGPKLKLAKMPCNVFLPGSRRGTPA